MIEIISFIGVMMFLCIIVHYLWKQKSMDQMMELSIPPYSSFDLEKVKGSPYVR